eukprot:CAMPEP_0201563294 /NCGR_PEP_ID=MMETSP0190_2-20130828/37_1 /ASSEMBLY_ACC=CAM_ASM_000263 /TAXON_ID=37353 /ORGANISM="Rosalina sp." /LENGTH=48 /DNA_ID= /DNA_START= /DNA_END= /DNA_ORIENTATION=
MIYQDNHHMVWDHEDNHLMVDQYMDQLLVDIIRFLINSNLVCFERSII